jgi:hypothetical protein
VQHGMEVDEETLRKMVAKLLEPRRKKDGGTLD